MYTADKVCAGTYPLSLLPPAPASVTPPLAWDSIWYGPVSEARPGPRRGLTNRQACGLATNRQADWTPGGQRIRALVLPTQGQRKVPAGYERGRPGCRQLRGAAGAHHHSPLRRHSAPPSLPPLFPSPSLSPPALSLRPARPPARPPRAA